MNRMKAIVDWVTERYIETGKESSVKEIAAGIGVSESTVRKAFDAVHGCPAELHPEQDSIACPDKYRPGINPDHIRKVWVYSPAKRYMAEIIKASRVAQ